MTFLWGFLPWIAYGVVSALGWQWAAATALIIALAKLVRDRGSAQVLDIGTVVYFAALTVLAFAAPDSPLQQHDGSLSSAWLALIAWTSLAVRRPFTLGIARQRTAPELWDTPVFVRTNTVITLVWTIAFTVAAVAGFVAESTHAGLAVNVVIRVLGFGVPMWFTHRYAAKVRQAA